MNYNLDKCSMHELKKMAKNMELHTRRSKDDMIKDISKAFKEYEEYKRQKIDKYQKINILGNGKEGTTYLVKTIKDKEYAMKSFKSSKSSRKIEREFNLQKKAYKYKICPKPYSLDTVSKYIIMEKLDYHLLNLLKKGLTRSQQERIYYIYDCLDKAGIFHDDANISNYMVKEDEIYIIDFGYAKDIDDRLVKKLNTKTPNKDLMTIGFILMLKEHNYDKSNYKYLLRKLPDNIIKSYNL